MPLYEYRCTACGRVVEVRHRAGGRTRRMCPGCRGKSWKRVWTPVAISFKGTGFASNR